MQKLSYNRGAILMHQISDIWSDPKLALLGSGRIIKRDYCSLVFKNFNGDQDQTVKQLEK